MDFFKLKRIFVQLYIVNFLLKFFVIVDSGGKKNKIFFQFFNFYQYFILRVLDILEFECVNLVFYKNVFIE